MKKLETQIVVIGGGVTGSGVLRDLAMRGLDAMLFERGNLSEGTTGNFHGLLHSGGRYAVKDQPAAKECIQENRILCEIASQAIEDTGGFFVTLDDEDERFESVLYLKDSWYSSASVGSFKPSKESKSQTFRPLL